MSDGKNQPNAEAKKLTAKAEFSLPTVGRLLQESVGDILSPNQQKQVIERLSPKLESLVVSVSKFHSGPLPSAESVRGYEDVVPGSFERILTMAEKDQDAFIESTRFVSRSDARYRWLCLAAGLVALAGILGTIVFLATAGLSNVALGVAGLGGAGIVTAFINARWVPKENNNGNGR